MRKTKIVAALAVLLPVFSCVAMADETIVAHETDRYFYKDGKILRYEGQFEYTYYLDLDRDTLTRTRVFDTMSKKITPDETIYHLEKQMLSHPLHSERYSLPPVVRAIGQTDSDTVELIAIEGNFVNIVSSSGTDMVISRCKRLN